MKYGEITHFSHPQHKLRFEYAEVPFKCDGCKEVGIGSRFKCNLCDYDLHRQCALPSVAPLRHAFYPKCAFQFLARPPGDASRFCNACERDVAGFVLHCGACGFDLHPCCAALPHVLDAGAGGGDAVRLYLYRKAGAPCHRCGRKGRSWSYRSACKKYNLHVACVMEMLEESWHELFNGGGDGDGGGAGKRGLVGGVHGGMGVGMVGGGYGVRKIPSIKGWEKNHHRGKGKVKRCCEVAAMAVQLIISAVLGDPTAIIAGIVSSFFSR
ncbi:C1-like domain [Musa troglodytarum]|uniref:C1-like domain n=1 Tax=Musa troglodytarum TaxID=320322 RepID=A0A9E7JQM0_9LILI|nr:C1-like domain [Musa troglodytarum]